MKTAISVPDSIFEEAERLAEKLKLSRSRLYVEALRRLLRAYQQGAVAETLNEVYAEENSALDPDLAAAQRRAIGKEAW